MLSRVWLGHALTALLIVAAGPAAAALSPYYQSLAEIERILGDPRLAAAFPDQAPVVAIEVVGDDMYEISAGHCSVTVYVVDEPEKPGAPVMVGPRRFTLTFDEPTCRAE